jgi:hypothetical protein
MTLLIRDLPIPIMQISNLTKQTKEDTIETTISKAITKEMIKGATTVTSVQIILEVISKEDPITTEVMAAAKEEVIIIKIEDRASKGITSHKS